MQTKEIQEIRSLIQGCFKDFYLLAHDEVKRSWGQIKKDDDYAIREGRRKTEKRKWDTGRALANLKDVADNPQKYFSVEDTLGAWKQRAQEEYSRNKQKYDASIIKTQQYIHKNYSGMSPETAKKQARSEVLATIWGGIVLPPHMLVSNKNYLLFPNNWELRRAFYNFCEAVQDFEYSLDSVQKESILNRAVRDIKQIAEKIQDKASVVRESNPIKRIGLQVRNSVKTYGG